jgi:nucleoside-diphosphate-sugar epimerase
MRVFMTGATGWIGSATARELLASGHEVVGLARSDEAAAALHAVGATARRGSLEDLDALREGAADADGVIHLGYNHDFSQVVAAAVTDRAAIEALGDPLRGTGRPLLVASGTLGLQPGGVATEEDLPSAEAHPRAASAAAALALADDGVRVSLLRFPPTVHGEGDHGFPARLVAIARERGCSAYVGEGSNAWSAVHRDDAAACLCLALERAPAGSRLHVVADEGVAARTIAEAVGAGLSLPVRSVTAEDAMARFGWMGIVFAMDGRASSAATQALLGWRPERVGLLDDLAAGHYFS